MSIKHNPSPSISVAQFNAFRMRQIYLRQPAWMINGFLQVCENPKLWSSPALREIGAKMIAVPWAIALLEMRDMLNKCDGK